MELVRSWSRNCYNQGEGRGCLTPLLVMDGSAFHGRDIRTGVNYTFLLAQDVRRAS